MPGTAPCTLTLPSDLAYLPVVRAFVESMCRIAGLDQKATEALVLATNEAASNVIRHAHQHRADLMLHLQSAAHESTVEVLLYDEGAPFNLCEVPHLDPAEFRIGGRGIFLMRALLDELDCSPRSSGGNVLRMVKRATMVTKTV